MKPARIDWVHRTNESFRFRIVLVQGPDRTTFDLSAYTGMCMQVKADRFQPEPELELTLGQGLSVESGGGNGAINGNSDVASIDDLVGLYAYDILGITSGGRQDPLCEGTILFAQGVTVI